MVNRIMVIREKLSEGTETGCCFSENTRHLFQIHSPQERPTAVCFSVSKVNTFVARN